MKLTDIVLQLAANLPNYTDKFHAELAYETVTVSDSGLVTVVTTLPHGLATGSFITIYNSRVKRRIIEMTRISDSQIYVTVDSDHDLTRGWQETVKISGCREPEFNGVHKLLDVPNRRTFIFELESENPNDPTSDTGMFFHEYLEIGLVGSYRITVIDDHTFTFQLEDDVDLADFQTNLFDGIVGRNQRVIGAVDIKSFLEMYEKQTVGNYYCVVCMDDAFNSKDRATINDSVGDSAIQSDLRSQLVEPFSVYIVVPTSQSLNAIEAIDSIYSEIKRAVYKCLVGYKFPTDLAEDSNVGTHASAHGMVRYTGAYYVHQFRFETFKEITNEDSVYCIGNTVNKTRAFRDLTLLMQNKFHTNVLGKHTNLDDVPLPPADPFERYGGD